MFPDLLIFKCFTRKRIVKNGIVIFEKKSYSDKKTFFEGGNRLAFNTVLKKCFIGYCTYFGNSCVITHTQIGKYCSIGSRVRTIRGYHPLSMVSTHPAFYSLKKQAGFTYIKKQLIDEDNSMRMQENGYTTFIENDVWIGSDVKIIDGVCIGNGAVVAAGALVCNDVPPYSIVGGVPAKVIKYRFSESVIQKLQDAKWWNKNESWIKENVNSFIDLSEILRIL